MPNRKVVMEDDVRLVLQKHMEKQDKVDDLFSKHLDKVSDLSRSQSKVILRPENQNYEDITINPQVDELAFEGSCVALLRESI